VRFLQVTLIYIFDSVNIYELKFLNLLYIQALRHVKQIAQESSGEVHYGGGRQPAVLRTFSQRLCK